MLMFFTTKFLFKIKLEINNMVLMLKAMQMFLKCFYDSTIKYFHDSLNIEVILASGREVFFAKCVLFPIHYVE